MRNNRFAYYTTLFLLSLCVLFVISGNTHNVEIQKRLLCHAMGIDFEQGEYEVSLQVFKPSESGSDTPVDITKSNIEVICAKGRTVSQAIDNCESQRGKVVFLGHLKLICLGEGVKASEPKKLFDFCLDHKTVYLGLDICCAETSAKELMQTRLTTEMVSTENYIDLISQNAERSRCGRCRLIDLLSGMDVKAVAIPVVSVHKEENKNEEPRLEITKSVLMTQEGILSATVTEEYPAVFLLSESGKEAYIPAEADGETIDIRLEKKSLKRTVVFQNGRVDYTAEMTVVAHRPKEFTRNVSKNEIADYVEKLLKKQFQTGFEHCVKENNADIFGVKKLVRMKYPQQYLKYNGMILESTTGDLKVTCHVD